ncbi:MAG: fibronectin type III domain-containing protein [Actinobacteria bacterium]|nr:MAG: fibronectin type III domain-containing protein [Actinomycetota bacterium]
MYGVVALTTSGVYVFGDTSGTFAGQTRAGSFDIFLGKYDRAGTRMWTRQFGTASADRAFAFAVDASGMHAAGYTAGTFSGQTSGGLDDAFLASLTEIPAQPPGPPANVQAAAGDGLVDLSWYQPVSDGRAPVTNYWVYRGTTSGNLALIGSIPSVLSYSDSGRTNGVTYYYAVSAVNSAGEGARSGEVSATPMGTGTAPTAAQNLQAVAGNALVTLTWQAPTSGGSSAITGYKVYRGTTSGSETLLVSVGVVLTYVDTGAANGQLYYYQVTATNAVGEGPRSNEASATPSATDSVRPTIAIASPADNSKLTATSVAVTGTSSDNVAVAKVELSTDGTTWTLATGTTSWSGSAALRAGANVIYARATDTSGNQVTAQVTVTVQTASTGPIPLDLMLLTGALITIIVSLVGYRFVIKVKHKREEPPRTPPASPPVR